jgi:hypothetical protein
MVQMKKRAILACLVFSIPAILQASSVVFTPQELFRVPFGKDRTSLGAKIEEGNLLIPRDFTMDNDGRVYIYDSNNHRIVRYSSEGKYEIGYQYPETAHQVFAHADSHANLWLLISDPVRGLFYGVYDAHGKILQSGLFSQYDRYRFHVDDDSTLHVILSSDKHPAATSTYILDEDRLLMKKEKVAPPPEEHHRVKKNDHVYFIDATPTGSKEDAGRMNHVTDESHHSLADIQGSVIYVTENGDIYTRLGEREIRIYDIHGSLLGKVQLTGLSSACASIRFDSAGNLYELDGIPDPQGAYTASMPGLRFIRWERHQ